MRIALSADERTGISDLIEPALRRRGHTVLTFGALADGDRTDLAWCSAAAARAVANGDADRAIVCCWTGTGASIAANKVPGIRAALCLDAETARGARRWNDANVLAISLRLTSAAVFGELLDAWLTTAASDAPADRANIAHVTETDRPPD
ncbi:MAG: RpiB/LacA/LacB family sugar-phosphate isomerase [Patulibacter minatonensis]